MHFVTRTVHGLMPFGTSIAVQQKLMRHADIRTAINIYGDVVTDEMALANTKVAELLFEACQLNGLQAL